MANYENDLEVPEHVERYLLRTTVNTLPREVVETLAGMSESELDALERLGKALRAGGIKPDCGHCNYLFSVH